MEKQEAAQHDYSNYTGNLEQPRLQFDVPDEVLGLIEMTQQAAFLSGWNAGQRWQADQFGSAPTVRIPTSIRNLEPGDSAWIQPHAIVEHSPTGELFLDPRFSTRRAKSVGFTIRLTRSEDGFEAQGPTDQHRIHLHPINAQLLPLRSLSADND